MTVKSYPPINRKAPFIWHGGDYNNADAQTITLPAGQRYRELLSGSEVADTLTLARYDVRILEAPV
jgi:hypothetical protein